LLEFPTDIATLAYQNTAPTGQPTAERHFMNKNFLIPFIGCFAVLIGSEYFLLMEMYNLRRMPVLISASTILVMSILCFWRYYRKYRKSVVEAA
jgi:hypothetical protein